MTEEQIVAYLRRGGDPRRLIVASANAVRASSGPPKRKAGAKVVSLASKRRATKDLADFSVLGANGQPRFSAPLLGRHIMEETPVAVGGGRLYVYRDGAYRVGEDFIPRRIAELLGEKWKRAYAEETYAWLMSTAERLDEDPSPDHINVTNGILVLRKNGVRLQPHSPSVRTPIQLPVRYDPDARCPKIQRFLDDVLPKGVHPLIAEIAGYLLVPDNRFQKAVMFVGSGGNGKSKLLGLLTALIGHANISARQLQDFDEDRFAVADLYGKLANVCADISSRELRSTPKFKAITGGDAITGERKFRSSFTFHPFARLLFSANEVPATRDGSEAFFDRWIVVPFEQRFRGSAEEDPALLAKLTTDEELSGFLNLALAGLARLRRRGRFSEVEETTEALGAFRVHADSVTAYFDERPVVQGEWNARKKLYLDYQAWCSGDGREPLSATRFYARLRGLRLPGELIAVERKRQGQYGFEFV